MTTLHNNPDKIPAAAEGCVLVIGNFDGIHLGHRALLNHARAIAQETGKPLGVMTFEPHPRRFFQADAEPFRLTLLPMKQRLLHDLGVDHLFVFSFNEAFSRISAEDFIEKILIRRLKASHIVVGENFSFGKGRAGTIETLKNKQFKLSAVSPVASPDNKIYSSTSIRHLLKKGNFADAAAMLGWNWQMEAPVMQGDKRGHALGFPTANQDMAEYIRIPYGVYAVRVLIEDEKQWRGGAANFGIRPMFKSPYPVFETFIFDFAANIYGKIMRVQPVKHLRPEMFFASEADLIAQMKEDCITAATVLKSTPSA